MVWVQCREQLEDFLNFERCPGLRGPETILGRNELGEDDCLSDVFEVLSDIAMID